MLTFDPDNVTEVDRYAELEDEANPTPEELAPYQANWREGLVRRGKPNTKQLEPKLVRLLSWNIFP